MPHGIIVEETPSGPEGQNKAGSLEYSLKQTEFSFFSERHFYGTAYDWRTCRANPEN
jgi:hypothetical protein